MDQGAGRAVPQRGGKTVVGFEIGRTKRYEFGVQGLATAPRGTSDLLVRTVVRNLRPATTYHYRLIARGPSRKGAVGAGASISQIGDGEVTLTPSIDTDFNGSPLPTGWTSRFWRRGRTGWLRWGWGWRRRRTGRKALVDPQAA